MRISWKTPTPNCTSYLSGVSFALSSAAFGLHISKLLAIRAYIIQTADSSSLLEVSRIAIIYVEEDEDIKNVTWDHYISYTWSIMATRLLQRAPAYDSQQAEADTRIPFIISKCSKPGSAETTSVIITDSDFPAISLANEYILSYMVFYRVA